MYREEKDSRLPSENFRLAKAAEDVTLFSGVNSSETWKKKKRRGEEGGGEGGEKNTL